jgi:hypothetical protein
MKRIANQAHSIGVAMIGIATLSLGWPQSPSCGYEFSTHAALTREAYVRWTTDPANLTVLDRLGLTARQDSLRSVYIDLGPGSQDVNERLASPPGQGNTVEFGKRHFDAANDKSTYRPAFESIAGWLMLGAIREDDVTWDAGALENTPQDDPQGPFIRVRNHFYDPFLDRALTFGVSVGSKAPVWAVTGRNSGGDHRNHFAVPDAREAMWRGLTLKKYPPPASGELADLSFTPSADVRTREDLRVVYWATTFRALGDIAHLLQDMAQPQHTRNDSHAGQGCSVSNCLGGHASYYEEYIEARATGATIFRLRERFFRTLDRSDIDEPIAKSLLDYQGAPQYDTVRFSRYSDFFSTGIGGDSLTGFGLANYSNRGFYSAGTNISLSGSGYPQPPPLGTGGSLGEVVLADGTVLNANGQPVRGALTLVKGGVPDRVYPARNDGQSIALSSKGAFDQFLRPLGRTQYTLNHYNYDDQARLLIPRAVAYSAGLLDFFFRGKMEISLPDEGVYSIVDHSKFAPPALQTNGLLDFNGFTKIRLRLKNTTDDITSPQGQAMKQAMSGGALVAVLKFRRNLCYVDSLDNEITDPVQADSCRNPIEEIVVSDPLINQSLPFGDNPQPKGPELTFVFQQQLPINAWDVILQVVYRGALGSEDDAVAVTTKNISEPTFVTTHNDTDHVRLNGSCYTPEVIAARIDLWNQLMPACRDNNTHKVADLCANVPFGVRYTTDRQTPPLIVAMDALGASDQRIAPRRFARFAVLGEVADPVRFTLDINSPALVQPSGYPKPILFRTYNTQADTATAGVFGAHRGIKNWDGTFFIIDGTTGAAVYPDCAEDQFDALRDAERYPTPLNISGWNDPP